MNILTKCWQMPFSPWNHLYESLQNNLTALRYACVLIKGEQVSTKVITESELREMLVTLASIGTSQHSLLSNRLNALYISETLIRQKMKDFL